MNIGEIIQNIATGGAALLGLIYIIGGLIVNLNLTRRGIVEYQILKVKYLAVIEGEAVKVNVAVGEAVAVGVDVAVAVGSGLLVSAVPSSPVMGITASDWAISGCEALQMRVGRLKAQMAVANRSAPIK